MTFALVIAAQALAMLAIFVAYRWVVRRHFYAWCWSVSIDSDGHVTARGPDRREPGSTVHVALNGRTYSLVVTVIEEKVGAASWVARTVRPAVAP